jgi:aerobic C4-dicarboxylate transport protein
VATVLIGTWTKQIDRDQVELVLSRKAPFVESTMSVDDHESADEIASQPDERVSTEQIAAIVEGGTVRK